MLPVGLECSSRDSLGIGKQEDFKAPLWCRDTLGRTPSHVGLGQSTQDIPDGVYCPQ